MPRVLASVRVGPAPIGTLQVSVPLLHHHADLLRQRRPPRRPRLHDGERRRPGPLAPPDRRRGLLPHRDRRARPEGGPGRRGARGHPEGVDRPAGPPGSPRPGPTSTSPTTTSSAPPSPGTTRAVQQFLQPDLRQRLHRTRTPTGACTACPARQYYTEDELLDGRAVPDPPHPGRAARGGELLLQAERLRATGSLEWYEANPDAVRPEAKRNEALGFIRGGLRDISITRTSIDWGVPVPWDERARLLRLVRRADQLPDRHRLRRGPGAVRGVVAGRAPPDRQGDHPVPLRVVAGHVHGRRHRPAGPRAGARLAAGRRREDVQVERSTRSRPAELTADFGVDPVRYHLLRDTPLGTDGDFSYEGIIARYNADLANNLGNLLSRVATVVGSKCGGVGPAPDPASRLAGRGRHRPGRGHRGMGRGPAPPGPRGHLAAHPGDQRRAGDRPSRGRPTPVRPSTPCWAAPSRSCASWPS